MIQKTFKPLLRAFNVLLFMLVALAAQAQDKINVSTEKVESWFEKNWIWVAGAVLLLIIIALFSSRGRSTTKVNQRKTTTVIKDPDGNVKSITTTEDRV